MAVAELTLPAMGGSAHVVLVARPGRLAPLADLARARLRELELRWSRFLPGSDVSRLNAAAGTTVAVHADTVDVVSRAVAGWQATGGRFDPTVGDAVILTGYDRDHRLLDGRRAAVADAVFVPGCAGIEIADRTVRLPAGVRLDLGGVGKGRAADLLVEALLGAGADGACVNLGGDLRVAGRAPSPDGWTVAVEDPRAPERELTRIALAGGAVATSSVLARRWQTTAGEAHHLIDPATGRPAATGLTAVTVVAGEAWWAEVLATGALLAGAEHGARLADVHGVAALLVDDTGAVRRGAGWPAYEVAA